jgi:hypothetical protein
MLKITTGLKNKELARALIQQDQSFQKRGIVNSKEKSK